MVVSNAESTPELAAALERLTRERTISRLFIFSDAVVAISATLLITIVLKLSPPAAGESFWQALLGQGGLIYLIAFGLSFALIMYFWRIHLAMTDGLRASSGTLITINCVWLGTIAFQPLPTYWFAASTSADPREELSFYLVSMTAVGLVSLVQGRYLQRHPELFESPNPLRHGEWRFNVGVVGFLLVMTAVTLVIPLNAGLPVVLLGLFLINRARWLDRRRAGAAVGEASHVHTQESVSRVLFFSDATVAIAVTLLMLPLLDLATPTSDQSVVEALLSQRGPLLSFLLAFFLVTYQWRLHHRTLQGLQSYTPRLLTLNSWWLVAVVFLPLPTDWVGRDDTNPRVVAFMWVCQGVVGLLGLGLWYFLQRHPELSGGKRDTSQTFAQAWLLLALYCYMLVLAVVYSQVSMNSDWTLAVVGLVVIATVGNRLRRRQVADEPGAVGA